METVRIRDPGWKKVGSATLAVGEVLDTVFNDKFGLGYWFRIRIQGLEGRPAKKCSVILKLFIFYTISTAEKLSFFSRVEKIKNVKRNVFADAYFYLSIKLCYIFEQLNPSQATNINEC
jgi:hypothetical protein